MRRRVVPALIGLLAAALAAWRRRARRAERSSIAEEPAPPALAEAQRQLAAPAAGEGDPTVPESRPTETAETARFTSPPPPGPRFVSVPWTLTSGGGDDAAHENNAPDLLELPIRFTLLGGRMELDRVDVRETESQVFVTVLARWDPPEPGRPWAPYGVAGEATIRLARPLGDRALVHAPDQLDELTREPGPGGGD